MPVVINYEGTCHRMTEFEKELKSKHAQYLMHEFDKLFTWEQVQKIWDSGYYIEIDGDSENFRYSTIQRKEFKLPHSLEL